MEFWQDIQRLNNSTMLTPINDIKVQSELEKQRNKAYNNLFSKAVSSVRQPIESLFNWLIEKLIFRKYLKFVLQMDYLPLCVVEFQQLSFL